ncbi:MAG: 5-methylcytosine-specific restriction protein B [Parvicellaceae bacterium]|jgi:5-methylcytosine-specific restriction protein B
MNEDKFSWVKTHKDIAAFLKNKENSQVELIELLKSIGITPFNDKDNAGEHDIELDEIDPFTFFCYIYKYGPERRLQYLQEIAKLIGASIPSDEKGIPYAQAQKVWLFPYKYERVNNEVSRLWSFFNKALNNNIENIDFEDVLKIRSVGKTKLSEALFYINPTKYLPINGPTKPYINEVLKIDPNFNTYLEYTSLLEKIKAKTDVPFYELSYKAWEWNDSKKKDINKSNMYSEQLIDFLKQAKTDNLKTKHFSRDYNDTKVKVSFGQGVSARIPWISFLKEPFTTSEGIYPVYLFYKNENKLVLAYGISETKKPQVDWEINNPIMIKDYFNENSLSKPDRYGDSFLFKIYDTKNLPNNEILDADLNQIIEQYQSINMANDKLAISQTNFNISTFHQDCTTANLKYSNQLVTRYITSLVTKPFVLLSGLSGSGKTKLAQSFAQWICEDEKQYCIVPVGADWTNREPLLGYVNALNNKEYILPENGALQLLIRANENQEKPYFLILDEMNLSHVERYFADFLSVMESKDKFKLHSSESNLNITAGDKFEKSIEVPSTLDWPKNLFVVGTVNIDETTYMFSPKVLDRANVIEFRINETEMSSYLSEATDVTDFNGEGKSMGESFVTIATEKTKANSDTLKTTLNNFFSTLQEVGAEFGYRTASEIQTLFGQIDVVNPDFSEKENEKIDIAIMQKLLPKLHGSRSKLTPILKTLAVLCYQNNEDFTPEQKDKVFEMVKEDTRIVQYPISLEKITRMYHNVISNGFTSYAEA